MRNNWFKKLIVILLFPILGYFVIAIVIAISGLTDNVDRADAIVILGNEVESNGEPSPRLKARLDKGLQLYEKGFAKMIIVSGGVDYRGFDEASVMMGYLKKNGVPESAIIVDNLGYDTYFTALNTSLLFTKEGWSRVIIVTQFYHIPRSRLAFEKFGIPIIYSAHAEYFEPKDIYSLCREVVAIIYYQVRPYSTIIE